MMLHLALLAAAMTAAPAASQTQVSLAPGESASFAIGDDGNPAGPPTRGQAEWTPFDVFAARRLSGIPIPDHPVQGEAIARTPDMPPAPPIPSGRIEVKLLDVAGRSTVLVVRNGYDDALVYQARMYLGDHVRPTDVCLVMPHRHGFEYWPNPLARLDLSNFHLVHWREGDPAPCA